jgi:benzoyl-CoA reductase/2-hydroxyglutaryl-CoA dehydratase subunit BcrC/BadD/HgdB
MSRRDRLIGITATIPVEIVYAAGEVPVDLNNLFITSPQPDKLVTEAERAGFSHGTCAWIKGIYAVVMAHGIEKVIAVTGGDCSNTVALGEVLARQGVQIIPFEYPLRRDRGALRRQMDALIRSLGTTWDAARAMKVRLDDIRKKLKRLDDLTFRENRVTGGENHLFLVNSSDFGGDPGLFEKDLDILLAEIRERDALPAGVRLGFAGVPPILGGFYEWIESVGGRVVFNESQRQFSMPHLSDDIVEQYLVYTYPYDMEGRLRDIRHAIEERGLHGLIHYTQTFCYRQIYDIILRRSLAVPVLTIEGDRPGPIDSRTAFRIESFIEMLKTDDLLF